MGFLDRVKEQAAIATAAAKDAAQKGQAKLDDLQAKRAGDALLRDLGAAIYAQKTGRSTADQARHRAPGWGPARPRSLPRDAVAGPRGTGLHGHYGCGASSGLAGREPAAIRSDPPTHSPADHAPDLGPREPSRSGRALDGCSQLLGLCFNAAGWSSLVARRAHNPKVVGSNPTPATNE